MPFLPPAPDALSAGASYPFQALLPSSYLPFKTHGLVDRKVQRAS